jgi:hypothetical protein
MTYADLVVVYVLGMGLLIVSVILVGLYRGFCAVFADALDGKPKQVR